MPNVTGSTIAVVGATGNVGRNVIQLLMERQVIAPRQLAIYASHRSAGKTLSLADGHWIVQDAEQIDQCPAMLYLFATNSDISKKFIPRLLKRHAYVIDASSLYRFDKNIPLIVAPVNQYLINIERSHLYAMANCVASPMSIILSALQRSHKIKRVMIATYQSTSGAGKEPMDELHAETKSKIESSFFQRQCFARQIAFNVIPQIDKFLEDGSTYEEYKIIHEIKKILGFDLPLAVTSVRVPVMIGHSAVVNVEFEQDFQLAEINAELAAAKNIKVSQDHYTTPIEVVGSDHVYVGRIRRDTSVPFGLQLWSCSDNLRRGAATDMVEVAEEILKQLHGSKSP